MRKYSDIIQVRKNKGVFTIAVTSNTNLQRESTNLKPENSEARKQAYKDRVAEGEAELAAITGKSDDELAKLVNRNVDLTTLTDLDKKKQHEALGWAESNVVEKAKALLKLDDSQIKIPEQIYANAHGSIKKQIRENYLKRRRFFLEELSKGKLPYISTDADGTCTFKTNSKVENSRSIGSLQDKYYLRLLLLAIIELGAKYEINTARPGLFPGPSIVGTEGPKFQTEQGEWVNPRSPNEISGILHEFGIHDIDTKESKDLFDVLVINGLSAAIKHNPYSGKLEITPATINYGKFIDKLNSIKMPGAENGFLSKLEEVVANETENKPLKVLEYKTIPWVFIEHPEFKVENFLRYISLVEKHREKGFSDAEFFKQLNESGIELPDDYYNKANPPSNEAELTRKLRKGMLACLVPHAFDSDNVVREEVKLNFYKTLAKFSRSEEAQDWAEKELGVPKGTDLFTINGKSVAHVDFDNFESQYKDLADLITQLKNKGVAAPQKEHVMINVVENLTPYSEIAPNTSKADSLDIEELRDSQYFVIGAGDSPGSDAVLLAQSILLGGAGFVVKGLMTDEDIGRNIVELLATDKNQWHDFALTEIKKGKDEDPEYRQNTTGEVKSKKEWVKFFVEHYQDKIIRCFNIHENNAFNAAIFSELFEGDPKFSMDFNENDAWAQTVLENTNRQSLVTPISEAGEKALEGQVYEKSIFDKFPLLKAIPFVGKAFDPFHSGKTFNQLLGVVSKALVGAAPVAMIADSLGFSGLGYAARLSQRFSYAINTIASGVSRGLYLSSHKFYWQFIGEMFGLSSTFFEQTNTFGRTLRALSNVVLIGRGNELAMRDNYNLDSFKDSKLIEEEFKKNPNAEPYFDKKKVAAKLTQETMGEIDYFSHEFMGGVLGKIPLGKHIVATMAQFKQGVKLAWDFVRIPEIRKHAFANIFRLKPVGHTKISKNSGKPYAEAFEANAYAFAGMATLGTALASTVLGAITGNKLIDTVLTNIANMIPALGIVTAGKLVHQDQAGDPRHFTDVAKKQQNFSPEKAGLMQIVSGWLIGITGAFQHTTIGAELYNLANGIYFEGIREQLKVCVDDAAVNKLTRQGEYYKLREAVTSTGASVARTLAKPVQQAA
ncbi:MAG: hypothetical protein O3C63_04585 [Cyanobacteria bacterium]|nr:hypothetical protein [Cyanobacteriota bacterium]